MDLFYLFVALLVCIPVHESAHALTAYLLGDPTAKNEGRITLNPLKHLDLLGTIMIFIAHFGWGKPTPFNVHNLKHPRRDSALIALAGPLSNLLTAFLVAILIKYLPTLPVIIAESLRSIFILSIVLFLFNLLPIAPLDGSKFVGLVIPRSKDHWYQQFLAQGPMILILLVVGDRLLAEIIGISPLGTFIQVGYEFTTLLIFLAT